MVCQQAVRGKLIIYLNVLIKTIKLKIFAELVIENKIKNKMHQKN